MVQGIVRTAIFTDDGDGVWISTVRDISVRGLGGVEALGPVLRTLYHSRLARRAYKGRQVIGQLRVPVVVLDARVDKLLLTKRGQLIGTKGVLIFGQERIFSSEILHVLVELHDSRIVCGGLCSCRVTSSVTGQNLGERDRA